MSKVFDISQNEEVKRYLDQGFEKAAEQALVACGVRLVSVIQNEIIPAEDPQPVDRGIYRSAWRSKRIKGGAEVFNTSPQGPIIERGARAENIKIGRAMIDALASWVQRKGLVKGKGHDAKAEARSVAFAIANAMKTKGIFNRGGQKGLRILDKAVAKLGDFVNEEFATEIAREFGEKG